MTVVAALALVCLGVIAADPARPDVVIRGAEIHHDDTAAEVIQTAGLVVAPGFIRHPSAGTGDPL